MLCCWVADGMVRTSHPAGAAAAPTRAPRICSSHRRCRDDSTSRYRVLASSYRVLASFLEVLWGEAILTACGCQSDGGAVADKVYGQYCGLAKALDLVGERWTLLIIRELSFGPRRFSDLVAGLRGISTAVLTERLSRLEDARLIIRRTLPPPAPSTVYPLAHPRP